jgi:hypothetical protein
MNRALIQNGLSKLFALAGCALLALACTGSETGNPSPAKLQLGLQSSDDSIASELATPGAIHVEQLWLSVESVTLLGCDANATETAINPKPLSGDLAQGVPAGVVPSGDYCGARVRLVPGNLAAPADVPVLPASVAVQGTRADGVPFAVLSAAPLDVTLPGALFAVSDQEQLLLAFDVSGWLRANVLDAATVVNGTALLDGRQHPVLTSTFESQVTVSLHRDENGNGAVDAAEAPLAGFH